MLLWVSVIPPPLIQGTCLIASFQGGPPGALSPGWECSVLSRVTPDLFLLLLLPMQLLACHPSQALQALLVPQALEGLQVSQELWQPMQLRTVTASGVN